MGTWVFAEIQGADVRRAPQEAELFKSDQAQEGEYAGTDALVREVIQNSLDASDGNGPVRIRIALHEAPEAPSAERLAHYFDRLREPLLAKRVQFDPRDTDKHPCRFLVCEDFGTRGLEGDTRRFSDPVNNGHVREDFYWFWRNIGLSGKTGIALGRWGLGKLVYRAASEVGCMLGLTVRQSDQQHLLMGQAVLRVHRHDGKEYQPEGFWCGAIDNDRNGLPLPIDEDAELKQFCREWKLTRNDEPGLSVVAPYVHEELKADRIVQAVAVNFLARILRGELIVEVVGDEIGEVLLDQATLEAACERVEWNGPKRMKRHEAPPAAYVRKCLQTVPTIETEILGTTKLPELGESSMAEGILPDLRTRFGAGELVSVRVRLSLPKLAGGDALGELDVYLQRDSAAATYDTYYVREGMTITKLNSSAGRKGVRGLVVVDRGPLAELLGDTEGPAHEDWQTSAERPNQTWKAWKGRVTFVRRIVDNLVELFTPPAAEPDFDLLADFFSIQRTQGEQKQRQTGDEQDKDSGMGPITPKPKWFHVAERAGGFTLSRNAQVPLPQTPALRLSLAYDLPQGDPLRTWSPYDFQISTGNGGMRPKGSGLKARRISGNVLTMDVEKDEFQFTLDGFDPHRDLFVRVDDISGEQDEEATS